MPDIEVYEPPTRMAITQCVGATRRVVGRPRLAATSKWLYQEDSQRMECPFPHCTARRCGRADEWGTTACERTGRFGMVVGGVTVVMDALELVDALVQLLGEHLQMRRRQHRRHAAKQLGARLRP
jgi:hypothetical protein